jgi:hypothetical protein
LGQVVRRHADQFLERWPHPDYVQGTLKDIAVCRTSHLGGHIAVCDHCGEIQYHYHSCGNRHCPQCGGSKRAAWLARCQADLLAVPYFHVVFTLPHELGPLALGNRKLMYGLLFTCAQDTLLEVAANPTHLGARIGALMVLHTWGQKLEHHPHIHCVVPGGGLAVAGEEPSWVPCKPNWFLPVKVLSALFRGKYLAALRAAHTAGEIQFVGGRNALARPEVWDRLIESLYQKSWVVYAKEPFGGPEQVLKYLTAYTHRVALSNRRLVKLENDCVTFTWKDYSDNCKRREITLGAVEFLRRFALHIVPPRFVRIRRCGLLANRGRTERLALCRSLLTAGSAVSSAVETTSPPAVPPAAETTSATPPATVAASDASSSGDQAGPALCPVQHEPALPRRLGARVLTIVASTIVAMAGTPLLARCRGEQPYVIMVEECCPSCGVGLLKTVWRGDRPGAAERRAIPFEDSS